MNNDRGEKLSTKVTAKRDDIFTKVNKAFDIFTTKRDDDARPHLNFNAVPLILSGGADAVNKRGFSDKALAMDNTSLSKMEGYMDKRCGTGSIGSWRSSLYFMVNNGFLNYYRHKSELKVSGKQHPRDMPTPRGSYDLGLVRRIELVSGGIIRLYFNSWVFKELRAPTIKEAQTWVKHLQQRRNWLLRKKTGETTPEAEAPVERAASPTHLSGAGADFFSEDDYISDDDEARADRQDIVPDDKIADMAVAIGKSPAARIQRRSNSLPNVLTSTDDILFKSRTTNSGYTRCSIIVTVLEAQDLPPLTAKENPVGKLFNKRIKSNGMTAVVSTSESRNPNAYVCLHAGNEAFWTRVRRNTCNPIWEENFVFGISGDPGSHAFDVGDKLLLSVKHTHFHRHELLQKQEFTEIGFVCLDIGEGDIQLNQTIDRSLPIQKPDNGTAGTLHVKIQKVALKSAKQLCSALQGKYRFEPTLSERLFLHRNPDHHSQFTALHRNFDQPRISSDSWSVGTFETKSNPEADAAESTAEATSNAATSSAAANAVPGDTQRGYTRTLRYRTPPVALAAATYVNATETMVQDTADMVIVTNTTRTPDAPYGSYFVVESEWLLVQAAPGQCYLRCQSGPVFVKSTLMRKIILNAVTKSLHKAFHKVYPSIVQKYCDGKPVHDILVQGLPSDWSDSQRASVESGLQAVYAVRPKDSNKDICVDALVPLPVQRLKHLLFHESSSLPKEHNAHNKWDHWKATPWVPPTPPPASPVNASDESKQSQATVVPLADDPAPVATSTSLDQDPIFAWIIMTLGQWADTGVGFAAFFLALMLGMVAILFIIRFAPLGGDANNPSLMEKMVSILVDMAVYPALVSLTCACALREILWGTLKVVGAAEQLKNVRKTKAPCRHLHNFRTVGVVMLVSVLLMLQRGKGVDTTNTIPPNTESVPASDHEGLANKLFDRTRRALHKIVDGDQTLSMWELCVLPEPTLNPFHKQALAMRNLTKFIDDFRLCEPHPPSQCEKQLMSNNITQVSDLWLIKDNEWDSVVGFNVMQTRRMRATLQLLSKLQKCDL